MLQYPSVIPADGMVLHPGMFGYGRLVLEAFDACILMTCFESTCYSSLADVHLSTGAWHFVDDACFSMGTGSLTLVKRERRVDPDLNTALMFKSLHPSPS